jgi:hypothetical protein
MGAALLAVLVGLNAGVYRSRPLPHAPLELRVGEESALSSAGLFALGMRRQAADLELIRLIVYYGTPETGSKDDYEPEEFDPAHPERHFGGGQYPSMLRRAKAIVDTDPAFVYPVLFASGALAFNLNRPDEALDLLAYALARNPGNVEFQSYVGAIGFHQKGDAKSVIALLEPALSSPDCPSMIKSMMAFLYKRTNQRAKAVALYRDIAGNSRDAGYRAIARKMLQEMGEAP